MADVISDELEAQERTEQGLLNLVNEKSKEIKKEIINESNKSNVALGVLQSYLEEDVPALYDQLKKGQ